VWALEQHKEKLEAELARLRHDLAHNHTMVRKYGPHFDQGLQYLTDLLVSLRIQNGSALNTIQ
jgi:hypothetical protein